MSSLKEKWQRKEVQQTDKQVNLRSQTKTIMYTPSADSFNISSHNEVMQQIPEECCANRSKLDYT